MPSHLASNAPAGPRRGFVHALLTGGLGVLACLIAGCGRGSEERAPAAAPAHHEHVAPHGGTAVELGHEEFHLELVLDSASGHLTAYVLDGELEQFIRIAEPSLRLIVRSGAGEQVLELRAVANLATGEKVGDTSQFEGIADWLKSTPRFDARLAEITVRGKTYRDVSFNFPKGNE
jgi:hypothetical protein